jgi:predicted nucleic acid-binding protein
VVLVDTSVWIRALAGKQPFRSTVDRLLADEMVLGHEMVLGELLIGDPGGRARTLSLYEHFSYAATIPHREVVDLVRARRLFGRGVGWIDAHLLASSLVARVRLYTVDGPLARIADELELAYRATSA